MQNNRLYLFFKTLEQKGYSLKSIIFYIEKPFYGLLFLFISFWFTQCLKEEALEAQAKFSYTVENNDLSAPVLINISNQSTGGDSYEWVFEGGEPSTSTQYNPGQVKYTQAGNYTVLLKVSNKDGGYSEYSQIIKVEGGLKADFTPKVVVNNYSPAEYEFINTSENATTYLWTFEGGTPASSTEQNPGKIVFTEVGSHQVSLKITNAMNDTSTKTANVQVNLPLSVHFTTSVGIEDEDFQAPITVMTQNNSISATSYTWEAPGATPTTSMEVNPSFIYHTPGNYTLKLTATNGKQTASYSQNINVLADTNLSILSNIKLGISSAQSTIGSYYSTKEKKVYTSNEVNSTNGSLIDIVYFGLSSTFSNNRFLSPTEAGSYSFLPIPNATQTNFINKQETCGCGINISDSQFDTMTTDALLQTLNMTAQNVSFNNTQVPRIIPFQTQDGRKGLIKIKSFVNNGLESYVLVDIKVQKQPS